MGFYVVSLPGGRGMENICHWVWVTDGVSAPQREWGRGVEL